MAIARRFALLVSMAAVMLGCDRSAGQGESCGGGTSCASGLVCSASLAKCMPEVALTPQCESRPTGCPAGDDGFYCYGGDMPNGPGESSCALVPGSGDGTPGEGLYCCTPVSHCTNIGPCGDAGVNVQCDDPLTPQSMSPSLVCATIFSRGGSSSYCCSDRSSCFSASLFACGDAGQSYACTGDAAPESTGLVCSGGLYEDAGTSGTYCCASDAGAN
jgi:hypothetical protein